MFASFVYVMFVLHAEKVTIFVAKLMVTFSTRNTNILFDVLVYNIEGKNEGNYIKLKENFRTGLRPIYTCIKMARYG